MEERRLNQVLDEVELGTRDFAELTLDDSELAILDLLGTVLERR